MHLSARAALWASVALVILALLATAIDVSLRHSFIFAPLANGASTETYLQSSAEEYNDNNFSGAIADADAALATDPNNVDALIAKASALAQEGSVTFQEQIYGQQAIAVARQALAIDPRRADAWRIVGYANEIMQNFTAAHAAYANALAIDSNDALTISQNAHAYDLQGDFADAEAGYQQALFIDPTLDQALMGMGRIDLRQGSTTAALNEFETAATSSQNVRVRSEGWFSAGIIEQGLGDNATAEQDMNNAVAADPTYAQAWVGLAKSLFQDAISTSTMLTNSQRTQLANQSFQYLGKALAINPNQSIASVQLGVEYAALGQMQNALTAFKGAEVVIPNDITLSAPDKQAMLAVDQSLIAHYFATSTSQ